MAASPEGAVPAVLSTGKRTMITRRDWWKKYKLYVYCFVAYWVFRAVALIMREGL